MNAGFFLPRGISVLQIIMIACIASAHRLFGHSRSDADLPHPIMPSVVSSLRRHYQLQRDESGIAPSCRAHMHSTPATASDQTLMKTLLRQCKTKMINCSPALEQAHTIACAKGVSARRRAVQRHPRSISLYTFLLFAGSPPTMWTSRHFDMSTTAQP